MKDLLILKFKHPTLQKQLLDTGHSPLIEGNQWNDTFWGVNLDTGEGSNHLGRLLEEVRYYYRKENAPPLDELTGQIRDTLSSFFGWKHLEKYSGMSEEWMDRLLLGMSQKVASEVRKTHIPKNNSGENT